MNQRLCADLENLVQSYVPKINNTLVYDAHYKRYKILHTEIQWVK